MQLQAETHPMIRFCDELNNFGLMTSTHQDDFNFKAQTYQYNDDNFNNRIFDRKFTFNFIFAILGESVKCVYFD